MKDSLSGYQICTDLQQMDFAFIHQFLSEQSYWAKGMSADTLRRALQHSLCFGGFVDGRQVAFARVVSDFATFSYLRDVFVDKKYQGRGYGKGLLEAIVQHPGLRGTTLLLHTNDAHPFYEKLGFYRPARPERQMLRSL